jgi:S-adenosylmethionine hydrolase
VSEGRSLQGTVVTVDHFGNLITDIEALRLEGFHHPRVRVAGRELRVLRTYGEASAGELLALINSFGLLEIAQSGGSAALSLNGTRGTAVRVEEDNP